MLSRATVSLAAAGCAVATGCATSGAEEVPTLASDGYIYDVREFVGQTVRACGRLVRFESHWAVEHVPPSGEVQFHGPPKVLIVPCGDAAPQLDELGCISGRIAPRTSEPAPPGSRSLVTDDRPVSRDLFLHPQCPMPGG